jgi:hypothetical protein
MKINNETQIIDLNNYCYHKTVLLLRNVRTWIKIANLALVNKKYYEELLKRKVTWIQIKNKRFKYTVKNAQT